VNVADSRSFGDLEFAAMYSLLNVTP
jgi:hypothetical protein